ncbi:MAG: hypothetical protein ACI835_005600 [Planctomycetota bacterium]|jgi:hypothetical protein
MPVGACLVSLIPFCWSPSWLWATTRRVLYVSKTPQLVRCRRFRRRATLALRGCSFGANDLAPADRTIQITRAESCAA